MMNLQLFSLCYTLLGAATAVWVVYWLGEANSGWGIVRTTLAYVIVCMLAAAFWPVVVGMVGGMRLRDRRVWKARARYARDRRDWSVRERYERERQDTAMRILDEQVRWNKAHRKDGWGK